MTDFKVAILIIGSLIWNPRRKNWREERLHVDRAIPVSVPIRYGRKSRSGTYTMVFSNESRLGWALAVPCKSDVSTADQLVEEARELWAAERLRLKSNCMSTDWGAVALLLNPKLDLNQTGLDEIRAGWLCRVKEEHKNYKCFKHGANEVPAVDQNGMLTIDWPKTESGDPLDVDLLLATANKPCLNSNGSYATPQEIADAWNRATNRPEYFCENRRVGITTADDCQITEHLRQEDA